LVLVYLHLTLLVKEKEGKRKKKILVRKMRKLKVRGRVLWIRVIMSDPENFS
jgi:hypothetical protein